MKFFCIFFRINFFKNSIFFVFWRKKIRRHLVKGALQGLVKICKRHMEVNRFLILNCRLEKYFLVE